MRLSCGVATRALMIRMASSALGVRHNQKPARRGHSESDHPVFTFGVIGIGARHCQWIMKRTGGFLKCYSMLAEVLSRLDGVPFEMHGLILSTLSYPVPLTCNFHRLAGRRWQQVARMERRYIAGFHPGDTLFVMTGGVHYVGCVPRTLHRF
jgi:hypothetical protein